MHTNFTPQSVADAHNLIWNTKYKTTASNVEEINIDNYNLDLLWDEINEMKKEKFNFPISFSPEIQSKDKLHEFYLKPEKKIGKLCNDVFSNIMIKSDGSVIPAHGRLFTNLTRWEICILTTLKEIWNSNVLTHFRADLINNGGLLPACSRCCSAF
ncbi:MAG: hypothetical protein HC854_12170 [Flavobacterium sp.]|nr:hypothetical protein [Flavobacterium sp.]